MKTNVSEASIKTYKNFSFESQEYKVFEFVRYHIGCTCEDIKIGLPLEINRVSRAVKNLLDNGWVEVMTIEAHISGAGRQSYRRKLRAIPQKERGNNEETGKLF